MINPTKSCQLLGIATVCKVQRSTMCVQAISRLMPSSQVAGNRTTVLIEGTYHLGGELFLVLAFMGSEKIGVVLQRGGDEQGAIIHFHRHDRNISGGLIAI
jgi:hypothetical protein